tara:strand:+ start:1622 stop:1924 length:303 start_codon:yes stop_codon:yes gene_type:complete
MLIAEPKTVVPIRAIRTDSSLVNPKSKFKKIINSISKTMKDVPETGSIPVSPMTLTAIAPRRKVVNSNTVEKIIEGSIGYPPRIKIMEIAKNERIMKIGI